MTGPAAQTLRHAFGAFMTGVTVVTTRDAAGVPVGFTANSFTSVSMDPPMLLVCPGRFLSSFDVFRGCEHFAVSILAEGQEDVSNIFAGFKGDRFTKVAWSSDTQDIPLIDDAAAQFSCRTHQAIGAGDHVILVGEILAATVSGHRSLGYAAGQYFSLGLERQSATVPRDDVKTIAGAIIEDDGRVLLQETPNGLRLPTRSLSSRDQVRSAVTAMFGDAGMQIDLGPAYAVFDDRALGLRHVYFLGKPQNAATSGLGTWHPVGDLADASFADRSTAAMLSRFAEEHRTRTFGLYIGDDGRGDIAPLQERM
ncbi:MAG: flavin reductase family protein [Pseudomonadota bacterium]